MFCFQCEQTDISGPVPGCAIKGMCGKDETTADLQDVLVHAVQGIAQYNVRARALGAADDDASAFILFSLFTTLTNVNFNATKFVGFINQAVMIRERVKESYETAARAAGLEPADLSGPATFAPAVTTLGLVGQAKAFSVKPEGVDENVIGLRALNLYGLKGVCAYAHHAAVLDKTDPEIFAGIEASLDFLASKPTDIDELLARSLALGDLNLKVMGILDEANTGRFGSPEPTAVRIAPIAGKALLVSGHDMRDLAAILDATEGTGVKVYTHGELLPANAYPGFKKYSHLAGNFGGAWQDQQSDFAAFPGAVVMTSNCIIEPLSSYRQRIFTTGPVGWPGIRHIDHDFTPAVQAALALPGFTEDAPEQLITIGFARDSVLAVADTVVDAVKSGALKHFFLIGGCDGASPGRNYYTDFALGTPEDTAILTLGCAKYRFNKETFGDIGGIPRLLDVGQCNDSFSAIQIALALADAFECGVNELPLTLVISWFEQKATAVLLTLLALGIRNIKLGPTLPVYLTPDLIGVLVEKFGIAPIGEAQADIAAALARA